MQLHSCIRYQVLHITWTVIFNIIMITTLAIFLSYVKTQAQDALNFQPMVPAQIAKPSTTADGGLQIGNAIPDELWDMPLQVVNHPQGKETITLAEYKDKLIILDFWGTACGTCITSLYKLDTLQSQLADDLAVIPVAVERADPVKKAVEHHGWNLPSVFAPRQFNGITYQVITNPNLAISTLVTVRPQQFHHQHYTPVSTNTKLKALYAPLFNA